MSSPTQAHQHQATSQATGTAHQQPSEQPQPQQQQLTSPTTNPNNNNTMESSILTAMQTRIINLEKTCYSLHKENTELADKVDELEECLMLEQDQVTTDKIRSTNRRINDHDRDLAMVRDRVRALELSLTQAIKGRNAQGQPVNGGGGLIPPNRNSKKRKTRPTPEILSIIPRPPSPEVELPVVMGENLKGVGQGAGRGVGGGGFGGGALTTGGAGGVELERVESMVCEVSKVGCLSLHFLC